MPGSRSPLRVLMGNPAVGVNAMLVSMHRPFSTAAMLAPLPKCARITRPRAARSPSNRPNSSRRNV